MSISFGACGSSAIAFDFLVSQRENVSRYALLACFPMLEQRSFVNITRCDTWKLVVHK